MNRSEHAFNEQESSRLHAMFAPQRRKQNRRHPDLMHAFFERIAYGMSECWFWVGGRSEIGYGMFAAARFYNTNEIVAHRLSWHLFKGPVPDGLNVLHRCDIRACVNPDHLFLGTQEDNIRDMLAKGRARLINPQPGERNAMAKLTNDKVRSMRARYAQNDISYKDLAALYDVAPMTAFRAVTGQSWNHL